MACQDMQITSRAGSRPVLVSVGVLSTHTVCLVANGRCFSRRTNLKSPDAERVMHMMDIQTTITVNGRLLSSDSEKPFVLMHVVGCAISTVDGGWK